MIIVGLSDHCVHAGMPYLQLDSRPPSCPELVDGSVGISSGSSSLRYRAMAASLYDTAQRATLEFVPWHIPWHCLHQSAVCGQMNVWPSMPMYVVSYGVTKVVGTWYWCDGVWIGFKPDGELFATDWLA